MDGDALILISNIQKKMVKMAKVAKCISRWFFRGHHPRARLAKLATRLALAISPEIRPWLASGRDLGDGRLRSAARVY
jgi:hypothetical protein